MNNQSTSNTQSQEDERDEMFSESGCCGGGYCGSNKSATEQEERECCGKGACAGDDRENEDSSENSSCCGGACEPGESTAEEKMQEYLDGWRRCQAEFDNYKKSRMNLDRDMAERALGGFASDILPIIDNFESATAHIPEGEKEASWVEGIFYIQKQLLDVLKEYGIEEVLVHVGDEFNPEKHEAVEDRKKEDGNQVQETSEAQSLSNGEEKIIKVLQKGYKKGDRIIRVARVVVG